MVGDNKRRPWLFVCCCSNIAIILSSESVPRSHTLPPLSVKKILTAVNPGQLAIFVSSLSINGYECEGYGFKVMNCKSFILKPNTSRKIEIAYVAWLCCAVLCCAVLCCAVLCCDTFRLSKASLTDKWEACWHVITTHPKKDPHTIDRPQLDPAKIS